jgi:hypothetical protein
MLPSSSGWCVCFGAGGGAAVVCFCVGDGAAVAAAAAVRWCVVCVGGDGGGGGGGVCLCVQADVYMFDEPSSYLDVKQRLTAAGLIRSLIDPALFGAASDTCCF